MPRKISVPVKVKSELVRLRLSIYLKHTDNDADNSWSLSTDCAPMKVTNNGFRTHIVGRDRRAQQT